MTSHDSILKSRKWSDSTELGFSFLLFLFDLTEALFMEFKNKQIIWGLSFVFKMTPMKD